MIKGKKAKSRGLPSEAALLEFIQTSPSVVGKREIARAFGLTGAEKIGLKALLRQSTNVSRCQLRGGVHMDEGFVNDVCLTPRFNQCVFYEDELTKG